jgi:hypothetical protein
MINGRWSNHGLFENPIPESDHKDREKKYPEKRVLRLGFALRIFQVQSRNVWLIFGVFTCSVIITTLKLLQVIHISMHIDVELWNWPVSPKEHKCTREYVHSSLCFTGLQLFPLIYHGLVLFTHILSTSDGTISNWYQHTRCPRNISEKNWSALD